MAESWNWITRELLKLPGPILGQSSCWWSLTVYLGGVILFASCLICDEVAGLKRAMRKQVDRVLEVRDMPRAASHVLDEGIKE